MGSASLTQLLAGVRVRRAPLRESSVAMAAIRFSSVALAAILQEPSVVLEAIPQESAAALPALPQERPPYVEMATTRSAHTTQVHARATAASSSGLATDGYLTQPPSKTPTLRLTFAEGLRDARIGFLLGVVV